MVPLAQTETRIRQQRLPRTSEIRAAIRAGLGEGVVWLGTVMDDG